MAQAVCVLCAACGNVNCSRLLLLQVRKHDYENYLWVQQMPKVSDRQAVLPTGLSERVQQRRQRPRDLYTLLVWQPTQLRRIDAPSRCSSDRTCLHDNNSNSRLIPAPLWRAGAAGTAVCAARLQRGDGADRGAR